jgi:hypothetical protein
MTPYVQLQMEVIQVLFKLVEREPDYLRAMVAHYRQSSLTRLSDCDYGKMRNYGFREPGIKDGNWDWCKEMLRIILAQVDDSGETLIIRNLLGMPIVGYGTTQTVAEYEQKVMCGACFLRTDTAAQPSALLVGDILATGEEVLSEPRCGGDGEILIHFSGGAHGVWLHVPARLALGLRPPPPVFDGTAETASLPIRLRPSSSALRMSDVTELMRSPGQARVIRGD